MTGGSQLERQLYAHLEMGHLVSGLLTEYRFDDVRKWRFDFAWPHRKIAVEVEGGTWSNGRHSRGTGFEQDCEKYDYAAILGWKVLRFTANMIEDGRAFSIIEWALTGEKSSVLDPASKKFDGETKFSRLSDIFSN